MIARPAQWSIMVAAQHGQTLDESRDMLLKRVVRQQTDNMSWFCYFYSNAHPRDRDVPFISKLIDFNERQGRIRFNGYYHKKASELPQRACIAFTGKRYLELEIKKRTEFEDTSQFFQDTEPDGTTMDICLFPTKIIELEFDVIRVMEKQ